MKPLIMSAGRRLLGRQLCRIGLHRWGRVREITGLDVKGISLLPDGSLDLHGRVTGEWFGLRCERFGCRAEQRTRRGWRDVGGHRVNPDAPPPATADQPPDPPPR